MTLKVTQPNPIQYHREVLGLKVTKITEQIMMVNANPFGIGNVTFIAIHGHRSLPILSGDNQEAVRAHITVKPHTTLNTLFITNQSCTELLEQNNTYVVLFTKNKGTNHDRALPETKHTNLLGQIEWG
jgi:hypothetical protein